MAKRFNPNTDHPKGKKDVIKTAIGLAENAMASRMWENVKPEEVATYCVTVATKIIEHDVGNSDTD